MQLKNWWGHQDARTATILLSLVLAPEFAKADEPLDSMAQDAVAQSPVAKGLSSSFAIPSDELLRRKHDTTLANLLDGLTVTPSLGVPFSRESMSGRETASPTSGSATASLALHYQPAGYWFAHVTLFAYLDPSHRAPWNPDFTYSFGYDDWHPYTLSLTYSNYANNRFSPEPGKPVSPISHGTIALGWKAPLPRKIARLFLIDESLTINCRVGLNATPRYDQNDGQTGSWKRSINAGCRYPITQRLYIDANLYAYGHGQQPWDPDFTYGFGLFDYRSNRFSIQYANYSGNRFPGHTRSPHSGRFRDGGVTISWSHGF